MKFKKGGCWESKEFNIVANYIVHDSCLEEKIKTLRQFKAHFCKHVHSYEERVHDHYDEELYCEKWKSFSAIIPFAVIGKSASDNCATGICAECIIEGMKKIRK